MYCKQCEQLCSELQSAIEHEASILHSCLSHYAHGVRFFPRVTAVTIFACIGLLAHNSGKIILQEALDEN